MAVNTLSRGTLTGQVVTSVERRFREFTLSFAIAVVKDMNRRREIFDRVHAWAMGGGRLTVSYRQGQFIDVMCTQPPNMGYIFQWNNTSMKMTFRAHEVPFWQAVTPDEAAITGSGILRNLGNTDSPLTFTAVVNKAMQSFNIASGSNVMTFTSGFTAGNYVELSYSDKGVQKIVNERGASVLLYRTGADDILLKPGENTITASDGITLYARCRGRWL